MECWGKWGCVEEECAEGGLSPDAFEMGQRLVEAGLFEPSEGRVKGIGKAGCGRRTSTS